MRPSLKNGLALGALTTLAILASSVAEAHVKWFSGKFDFTDKPRTFAEIFDATFVLMAVLSLVTIGAMVLAEPLFERNAIYRKMESWLDARRVHARMVMRVTAGIVLLLSWQAGVLFAAELVYPSVALGWFQFALIVCLFHPATTRVAGAGILVLFAIGVAKFGLFHMLDYAAFVGVATYLMLSESKSPLEKLAVPALFATTGFSLCWLAMEKLVYPQWGTHVLTENPVLALGLPVDFFLVGAAFIEFCLGFLLLIGLLGRPLASIITLVFFLTTMVFGKEELIGHSVLHGILIVFMLEGTKGALRAPIRFHDVLWRRFAFGTVNLVLAFGLIFVPYQKMAEGRSNMNISVSSPAQAVEMKHGQHALQHVPQDVLPTVRTIATSRNGVVHLQFELTNLSLAKRAVGTPHKLGEGHIHLYVDGKSRGQVFETQYTLRGLQEGEHTITAELGTNDHQLYASKEGPVRSHVRVDVGQTPAAVPAEDRITEDDLIYFEPLPKRMDPEGSEAPSQAMVDLGRMLYYETALSKSGKQSCNSCHLLERFGVDNEPTSAGHRGQRGDRNSPTVYNAGGYLAQFWDGRAEHLEAQAKGPILNPIEMAMPDAASVKARLQKKRGYATAFQAAFPNDEDPIRLANVQRAIGAFERGLTTPGAFDEFLSGREDALSASAKRGLKRFTQRGCATCHNGPAIGGQSYQRVGLIIPYEDDDPGRYAVTKDPSHKQMFKVPSLRNIARTGPYFHDGSIKDLSQAVRTMAHHQLGQELPEQEVRDIVAFLESLTGQLPVDYIKPRNAL